MNIGEEIVGDYLRYELSCQFIDYNIQTKFVHGEIDIIGINSETDTVYICEVTTHMLGLQYVKNARPNTYAKLKQKFLKDIEYAERNFSQFQNHKYMFWSPVVKLSQPGAKYDAYQDCLQVVAEIRSEKNVDIELVINAEYARRLEILRSHALKRTDALTSPVMRLFQIEAHLQRHIRNRKLSE